MTEIPVVDVCGVFFDEVSWEAYLRGFADRAPRYLAVFGRPLASAAGLDTATIVDLAERRPHAAVDRLLASGAFDHSVDDHVDVLRRDGIRIQVVHGRPDPVSESENVNDRVAAAAAAHPDVLQAWAGLSLVDPDEALIELERCTSTLGMSGASIIPFLDGVDPASEERRPVFAALEERELPVWIHTGQSFRPSVPMDLCGWRQIDAIAGFHPSLSIVVGHGGWPFVRELVGVCQRHPNVYVELSSHPAKLIAAAGSGWEPLMLHGRRTIRGQVLFGSTAWVHNRSVRSLADELAEALDGDRCTADWLGGNALQLLAPDPFPSVPA